LSACTLSWSQSLCRLLTEKGQPVEGAIVTYTPVSGGNPTITFSDRKGEVRFPDNFLPLIIKVQMMGFATLIDTLRYSGASERMLRPAAANLGEVVVTGDYRAGYQTGSVHQVDVITRDEIDRRAAVNVQDLLSQELNMRISNDPAMGSSVAINGTGGEHIKFLVDGVPVTGRKNGNIDLAQLNLNNVERVEIIKGPMSVLYGSDAIGGVVNLITRKQQSGVSSGRVNTYYESVGTYNFDATAGAGIGKFSANLNAGRNFFDGWSKQDTGRWQQWKPREQYFGDLRIGTTFHRTALSFTSSYFREEIFHKSEPVITPYFAYATDQNYRTWRVVQQLQATQQLSKSSSLQLTAAYSWYQYIKNTWRKDMVNMEEELTGDFSDDDTTTFKTIFSRLVYNWNPDSSAWSILAGAELNNDNAFGQRIDGQEHTITDVAVFTSVDYKWKGFTFRPSARFIYNSRYDAPLVPAFNVLYTTGKMSLRAGYSAGFRSPSLKELYLDFFDNGIHNVQGNPDLEAENSDNFTFSTDYRSSFGKVNLTASLSAFYNEIKNRITLVEKNPVTGLYMYDNLDEFYSRGGEIRGRAAISNFNVEAGFAYTGTNDIISGYAEQADIAWYPEFTAAADYTLKKYKTTFSLFWKNYGERPVYRYENNTPVQSINEGYQLLDASIRQPFLKDKLQVTAGAKNLLDVTDVRASSGSGVHSGSVAGGAPMAMGTFFFTKISFTF